MAAKRTKTVLHCLIPAFLIGVLVWCAPEPKETTEIEIPQENNLENTITPEVVALLPTPTPTPVLTPEPTPTPEPIRNRETPEEIDLTFEKLEVENYPEPTPGFFQMGYYLRSEPSRIAERTTYLKYGTKVYIHSRSVNIFNEPWYYVSATVDGQEVEGYAQGSTTQIAEWLRPTPGPVSLLDVDRIVNPQEKHGPDRDGDGTYVIVLDPGHGGKYPGATSFGLMEKDLNLKVGLYVREYLEEHYRGVTVYMTRSGDYAYDEFDPDDDLEYRARLAVQKEADLILSMHFNAYNGKQIGAMVLVGTSPEVGEKERIFASYLLEEMGKIGIRIDGIKRKRSAMMRDKNGKLMDGYLMVRLPSEVGIPSVIIEHCFMDNYYDHLFCNTDEGLMRLAEGDALAIAAYLDLERIPDPPGSDDDLTDDETQM